MNRNRRHRGSSRDAGNIPSLMDMSGGGGSTGYGNGSQSYSSYGSSQDSYNTSGGGGGLGSNYNGPGGGFIGGMTAAEALSTPMGYSFGSSQSSNGSGRYSSNNGPGLLGDGILGSGGGGGGGYDSGSSFGGRGFSSSGYAGSSSSSLGGGLDELAAKVRLQQQMLADERQKSVQQQIQEQLEKQNRKRLEYNRMKRDKETQRRGGRDRQSGDRRRSSASKDDLQESGLDDVHVTIKPRSEGRAVSDNTGGRKRNLSDKSRNQQAGSQNAKKSLARDNSGNNNDSTGGGLTGPFKCHVCIVTCRDMKGYELHMKGRKHREIMDKMKQVTEYQAQKAIQRLEAEKHLKKAQGRGTKDEDDHYCRDCLAHYTGDLLTHRRTNQHKESRRTRRPHCRVCDVTFKTAKKYVAHCNTPGHKKVYEAAKLKGEQGIEDEDFVTVDSIGEFDEEGNATDEALLAANLPPEGKVQDLGEGFNQTIKVTTSEEDDVIDIDCDVDMTQSQTTVPAPNESASDIFASSSADDNTIDDLVSAQLVSETESMMTNESSQDDKSQTLAEYDPDVPIGRHLVVPVWGYFCRPCRKFYQSVGSQGAVLDAHCKTREHYDAYTFTQGQSDSTDGDTDMDYLSLAIAKHQESKDDSKE